VIRVGGQKTREEIKALLAEGWSFRKKSRKGTVYISSRKNGKEVSQGAFDPKYWDLIEAMKKDLKKDQAESKKTKTTEIHEAAEDPWAITFNEIIKKINQNAGINCLHAREEEFCDYWRLNNLPEQATGLTEKDLKFLFKEFTTDTEKFWLFHAFPVICINCQAYIDEATLNFIKNIGNEPNNKNKGTNISFKISEKKNNE
jgi:hypothetical protein